MVKLRGRSFYVKFYKPSNFNRNRLYPVVFDVYGGPTLNKVSTRYKVGYDHYLAGRYRTIVVTMDVRGTPGRSDNFQHAIYKKFGTVEVDDTIDVIKWVSQQPYIDSSRMGIMGASYGGYLVMKILEAEPRLFVAAVSAAAVSNWRWYDTAYTERYLGLYDEEVYERASVIPDLWKVPNGVLILLHGLSDTNVLIRHHWAVVRELNRRHKVYSHYVKPGQTHRLKRLFHTLLWFRDKLWRRGGRRCWIG
jgi:dipeptidyl aminopeptidase/acylaminoacyl peptidase